MDDVRIKVRDLLKNETRLSILLILSAYKTLNLRQLSKVLGMTEPSAHVHIKELLKLEQIELDQNMAGKRGKYYQLTQNMKKLFFEDEEDEDLFLGIKFGSEEYYKVVGEAIQSVAIISQRFGIFAGKYLMDNASILSERYNNMKEEEKAQNLSGNFSFITIASEEEYLELIEAQKTYMEKLTEISSRNVKLKEDEIHENIMVTNLAIPLKRLDPRSVE